MVLGAACTARAGATQMPAELVPPAPFPLVVAQALETEFVAPGIERGTYRLQTSAGPLTVSVVVFDPREPSLRIGTVLAQDRIVSGGETVSSMAARSGAVAGINADYFDIGNTNSPLGILAQNGALVRSPSSRTALTVERDRSIRLDTYRFSGSAVDNGTTTIPITAVNEWPPHEGAAFLTPTYGSVPAAADCVVAELTPDARAEVQSSAPSGRYRVTAIDTGTAPAQPGFALALGPAAQNALTTLPDVGDLIDVTLTTDPPLGGAAHAIGGGPALLRDGMPVDDPASPGYAERARRIPVAAVAVLRDGDVALVVIDGRRPEISIGVNRAELIALLGGLTATDALQFDSGGSATLVARKLGEARATVMNEPSDGAERPVADGLFLYSDAPVGPPARLVVRPSSISALPDVVIPLRSALVDAAGHALGAASGPWHVDGNGAGIDSDGVLHLAHTPLTTTLRITRDGVSTELPLDIIAQPSKIDIVPERPDVEANASVALRAVASDERGRSLETGDRIRWTALRGTVSASGIFTASNADGFVTATLGDVKSSEIVHVGHHDAPLAGFDDAGRARWHFSSVPADGPGSLVFTPQGTLQLSYDFSGSERAAYAVPDLTLGEPLALSCAIDGDGGGAGIRIALLDRYGERVALTLAKAIDWTGTRRRAVRVPAALAPPIVLQSVYVVGSLGSVPVKTAGTIGVRACEVTLPGTTTAAP